MPKRMFPDPSGRGRVFWRYAADAGMYLLDERTGRLWRFDDALTTRQDTLAVAPDFKRLAVAKESHLVLYDLREGD